VHVDLTANMHRINGKSLISFATLAIAGFAKKPKALRLIDHCPAEAGVTPWLP